MLLFFLSAISLWKEIFNKSFTSAMEVQEKVAISCL